MCRLCESPHSNLCRFCLVVIYKRKEGVDQKGYTMKDYMTRETFKSYKDNDPWRDFEWGGKWNSKPITNEHKRKAKRRCRHRMKQQLNKELREYM